MTPFFSLKPAAVCGTAAEYPAVRFGRGGDDIHANTLEAACHVPARTVTDGRDALRTRSSHRAPAHHQGHDETTKKVRPMKKIIKIRSQLIGKRYLTENNQSRIVARDNDGNEWRIRKEPEGYIFRHTAMNAGIYGFSDSIPGLVFNALTKVTGIEISIEDAP